MPFLDVPSCRLTVFYAINPVERIAFPVMPSSVNPADQDPDVRCAPYDPSKPTLVFIHANCRSVAAFDAQLLDIRLRSRFNVLAFARRFHGRTRFSGDWEKPHDLNEAAAESIAALDALCFAFQIPRYSVFAEGIAGCHVVSLVLASPGELSIPNTTVAIGLRTILDDLCQNKDGKGDGSGTIPQRALDDNAEYCFGYGTGHSSIELRQLFLAEANRMPIPAEERAKVTCPVLLLHGTRDTLVSPLSAAEEWQRGFVNAKGGADLKSITDGPHLLSFIDANVVNRILLAFTSQTLSQESLDDHIRRTNVVR
ncbi:hypothetical protein JCM10213_001201 [Rhodosporidiobolus nylandii]